jgi:hypothetical protein
MSLFRNIEPSARYRRLRANSNTLSVPRAEPLQYQSRDVPENLASIEANTTDLQT